MWPTHSLDMTE